MKKTIGLGEIVQSCFPRFLIWLVVFHVVGFGIASSCNADQFVCNELASMMLADLSDSEDIKEIQERLDRVGYRPISKDGVIGVDTERKLEKFCVDFKIYNNMVTDDLENMLSLYAQVAKAYSDWKQILLSKKFEDWVNEQAVDRRMNIDKITHYGPPHKIIELIYDYKYKRDTETAGSLNIQISEKEKFITSFVLTKDDIKELKEKNDALKEKLSSLVKEDEASDTQPLDHQSIDKLNGAIEPIPESVIEKINKIQDIDYANENLFIKSLCKVIHNASDEEQECNLSELRNIVDKARKRHVIDINNSNSINWKGGGCGCVKDLNGIVYGFYPFWLTEVQDQNDDIDGSQELDFSILTRIGYFAITLDQRGNTVGSPYWNTEKKSANFINVAHRHRSKVDMVIYKNDWQAWAGISDKEKDVFFQNATINIVELLTVKPKTVLPNATLSSTLGIKSTPALSDGVTLYFDGFPEDDVSVELFVQFIKELRIKLKGVREDYYLNIMQTMDTINKGVYAYERLKEEGGYMDSVDLFLVFIEEPTTDTKKELRNKIEDGFKGVQRRNMLRKIIPIISPRGHDRESRGPYVQFSDDLIYFQDNFAGVGFWPLPMSKDIGADDVKLKVIKVFEKKDHQDVLKRAITSNAPQICNFACPNRWAFRIAFDLLIAVFMIYGFLSIWIYWLRKIFRKYRRYFLVAMALTMLIFFTSLVCDPFWSQRSDDVFIVLLLLGGLYMVWRYVKKMKQGQLP